MSSLLPRPGLQTLPTPYIIKKSRIAAFFLETSDGALQTLLDATLNAAATPEGQPLVRRFTPLLDAIMLAFIHYPDVHAEEASTPAADRWGNFSYQECAVYLLLDDAQGGLIPSCWHVPMILLNEGIPLILGREVYGLPKVLARLDLRPLMIDDWIRNPAGTLTVAAEGFPQRGAGVPVTHVQVAEVTVKGPHFELPFDFHLPNRDPLDLLGFARMIPRPPILSEPVFKFFRELISAGLPGIFLKQFPAGDGVAQAVYRKLVTAAFTPTAIAGIGYVRAQVKVFDPASYPLASTFGLTAGTPIDTFGIYSELDWVLPAPTDL